MMAFVCAVSKPQNGTQRLELIPIGRNRFVLSPHRGLLAACNLDRFLLENGLVDQIRPAKKAPFQYSPGGFAS